MEIGSIVLSACITIFALGMFIVSLLSYKQYTNKKLLFVSVAFFIFFIKGAIESIGLFSNNFAILNSDVSLKLFDLVILISLFAATLKR
jgi:hypothetical protein